MTVWSRANLYGQPGHPAINAHLHSILQHELGGWNGFHAALIQELGKGIQAQLDQDYPGRYIVDPTKAMQIRDTPSDIDETGVVRSLIPDAVVFEIASGRPAPEPEERIPTPTLMLSAIDTVRENEYLTALDIREISDGQLGESVTWIEVLSDANKVGGSGYKQYREKRATAITNGKSLVEFDFLHESSSPIRGIPSYRRQQPGATAYSIAITDLRPLADDALRNKTRIYGFGVDEPIPEIYIPLRNNEAMSFDPGPSYNRAFESFPAFGLRVDYSQWPPAFDTYQRIDQHRLALRRWLILNANEQQPDSLQNVLVREEIFNLLSAQGRLARNFTSTLSGASFDPSTGVATWIGHHPDELQPNEYIAAIVRCWIDLFDESRSLQVAIRRVGVGTLDKVQSLCSQLENLLQKNHSEAEFLAQVDNFAAHQGASEE